MNSLIPETFSINTLMSFVVFVKSNRRKMTIDDYLSYLNEYVQNSERTVEAFTKALFCFGPLEQSCLYGHQYIAQKHLFNVFDTTRDLRLKIESTRKDARSFLDLVNFYSCLPQKKTTFELYFGGDFWDKIRPEMFGQTSPIDGESTIPLQTMVFNKDLANPNDQEIFLRDMLDDWKIIYVAN